MEGVKKIFAGSPCERCRVDISGSTGVSEGDVKALFGELEVDAFGKRCLPSLFIMRSF